MSELLIASFFGVNLLVVTSYLSRSRCCLEFPFLAALVMLLWVGPQLIGIFNQDWTVAFSRDLLFFHAALCSAAIPLGWRLARQPRSSAAPADPSDQDLTTYANFATIVGITFFILVLRYLEEFGHELGTQWSGAITILFFFSRFATFAFFVHVFLLSRKPSVSRLVLVLPTLLMYLYLILYSGRRGPALEFLFGLGAALYFERGRSLSTPIALAAAFAGALLFNAIGQYRGYIAQHGAPFEAIAQIDFLSLFLLQFEGSAEEVRNAMYAIFLTDADFSIDFGASHWNEIVHQFVPAQLVGRDLKSALMFRTLDEELTARGYYGTPGTTLTGLADSFRALHVFGFLVFAVIAACMNRIWQRAINGRRLYAISYAILLTPALHSITHSTGWFSRNYLVFVLFFLVTLKATRLFYGGKGGPPMAPACRNHARRRGSFRLPT